MLRDNASSHICIDSAGVLLLEQECGVKKRIRGGCYGQAPDFSRLLIPIRKMLRNHSREYWYMGSTLEKSDTQK